MEISDHPTPHAATVTANPGYSLKQSGKIALSKLLMNNQFINNCMQLHRCGCWPESCLLWQVMFGPDPHWRTTDNVRDGSQRLSTTISANTRRQGRNHSWTLDWTNELELSECYVYTHQHLCTCQKSCHTPTLYLTLPPFHPIVLPVCSSLYVVHLLNLQ